MRQPWAAVRPRSHPRQSAGRLAPGLGHGDAHRHHRREGVRLSMGRPDHFRSGHRCFHDPRDASARWHGCERSCQTVPSLKARHLDDDLVRRVVDEQSASRLAARSDDADARSGGDADVVPRSDGRRVASGSIGTYVFTTSLPSGSVTTCSGGHDQNRASAAPTIAAELGSEGPKGQKCASRLVATSW